MDEISNQKIQDQQGINENSSNEVGPASSETVIVVRSQEAASVSAENGDSKPEVIVLETSKVSAEEQKANQIVPAAFETVIVVRSQEATSVSEENGDSKLPEVIVMETSKVSVEEEKMSVSEPEKHSCVVDIKCSDGTLNSENWEGEKICRICHLSSYQSSDLSELIQLGCGCKDELGFAHNYCAETWFRLKGNRCCEICGETAKNITGVGDNRIMEEWSGRRYAASSSNPSSRGTGCWQGRPFCNFLMACLVIAFMLPWFLRVNMF